MKQKYESTDDRTGIPTGTMVELSEEELNKLPFNVFLKQLEVIDDKETIRQLLIKKEREELRVELRDKGLSPKRTALLVEKYGNKEEFLKHADNVGIDSLTDEWVKNEYGTSTKIIKKKINKRDE